MFDFSIFTTSGISCWDTRPPQLPPDVGATYAPGLGYGPDRPALLDVELLEDRRVQVPPAAAPDVDGPD